MRSDTLKLTTAAVIAAIYVILTFVANAAGMASGPIQMRLSEALTVLPVFSSAAVPGLFVGCLLANLLTGGAVWDVIIGSTATLLGALGTRAFRKYKWSAPIFPIISNSVMVPFVLQYIYKFEGSYLYFMITVGAGEILSCGLLGLLLLRVLERSPIPKLMPR